MPTTTMTIKLINQPGSTGRGSIVGTDDQRLGIFPEKASLFEVGRAYEIEYTETERNGKTLRNVKSAKPIAAAGPAAQPAASPAPSSTNGHGNGNGHGHSAKDEQIFVQGILQSLIRAGEVKNDKAQLFHTVNMLKLLYQHTFGHGSVAGGTFSTGEAGQQRPRLVAAE